MEMQRSLLLMYASCGWFFDDIAGVESMIDLRRAAHAMDLWRSLDGRPPEDAFLDVLARAKSNQPERDTGADVFRRVCRARVTPARVVAAASFAELISSPAVGYQARRRSSKLPGFDVALAPEASENGTLAGQASVVHRRSGEITQLAFSTQYDGRAGLQCRIGKEHLTLADLDDDTAQTLRLSLLAHLAEKASSAAMCEALADVASHAGPLSDEQAAQVRGHFAVALIKLLQALQPGSTDAASWDMVSLLVERSALRPDGEYAHRAQEAVWEHLSWFRASRRRPPKALRGLAERLGFDLASG
jgi:hypothetical protein